MHRITLFVAGLLTASAGLTQSAGGPSIAYVKGSPKGDAIYLINPDGTGETKVYQAPRNGRFGGQIDGLSLRPGGGEVAFLLNSVQLMVQKHGSDGQPVGSAYEVDVPGNCALADVDYRSDGVLQFPDGCSSVWSVAPDATSATLAFTGANWAAMATLGTSLPYVENGAVMNSGDLKLRTAGGSVSTITSLTYSLPLYVDAAGNRAVVSQTDSFRTVDLSTRFVDDGCTTGGMVQLSPDGTQMIYEFRNVLFVHNSDCSGAPFRLARGAELVAWRSD